MDLLSEAMWNTVQVAPPHTMSTLMVYSRTIFNLITPFAAITDLTIDNLLPSARILT
jgi:hypothetical protein